MVGKEKESLKQTKVPLRRKANGLQNSYILIGRKSIIYGCTGEKNRLRNSVFRLSMSQGRSGVFLSFDFGDWFAETGYIAC